MSQRTPFAPGLFSVEALYENAARLFMRAERWRRVLVDNVAPRPGDVIAEIGCGAGALAVALAMAAPRALVIGVDPDAAALVRARQRAHEAGAKIEFARGFGSEAAQLLADWAPNKIIVSFVERPTGVSEKRATIAAAHAALRGDGVLHLADLDAPNAPFLHSAGAEIHRAAVEKSARASADSVIGMMRRAGFVAAEQTESFAAPRGAVALYRARIF
jgi:precorrin-6B methylase 2